MGSVYGHDRLRALGGSWYVGDALGSVRQTLDDAGAVLATAAYDPWGTPQDALVGPFGFTGELHHGDQVYLRARWYAPGWGTFPTRDPFAGWAETPYSLHAYQYAYRAPTVWTDPSGECVFAVVDTIVCVGGVTFTMGQAIALVTAVGSATAATYDACMTQGGCDRLARDLEHALQQRQATVRTTLLSPRDAHGLPTIPGIGGACAANTELTREGTTQAIQAAEARLVETEGVTRNQLTILYRGTALKRAYERRSILWTTASLSYATVYAAFDAAAEGDTAAISIYSIPTVLLQGLVASGKVQGGASLEYGFTTFAQPFLIGPVVVPVPMNYRGEV